MKPEKMPMGTMISTSTMMTMATMGMMATANMPMGMIRQMTTTLATATIMTMMAGRRTGNDNRPGSGRPGLRLTRQSWCVRPARILRLIVKF